MLTKNQFHWTNVSQNVIDLIVSLGGTNEEIKNCEINTGEGEEYTLYIVR